MGGIFENRYTDKDKINELAQIPDMLVLRGQFANIINSPIQRIVTVLSKIAEVK